MPDLIIPGAYYSTVGVELYASPERRAKLEARAVHELERIGCTRPYRIGERETTGKGGVPLLTVTYMGFREVE